MFNISITGANGYIGSKLRNKINNKKFKINSFVRDSNRFNKDIFLFDLKNRDSTKKLVINSDIVYYLAGNTSLYFAKYNFNESYKLTVQPIKDLISICKEYKKKIKIVYASTATVYGNQSNFPIDETTIPKPITIYDKHKLLAEKLLIEAMMDEILSCYIVRFSNIYGPSINETSSNERGVLNKICWRAIKNDPIIIYGSGKYLRDYVYIDDAINALLKIGLENKNKNKDNIYNICSNEGINLIDAFNLVISKTNKIFNFKNRIIHQNWPSDAEDIEKRNFIGCNKRLKRDFDWFLETNLESGIEKTLKNFINLKFKS